MIEMAESLICAVCDERLLPDSDHVHVEAELKRIRDRDRLDEYYVHPDCWADLVSEWSDPG